MSSQDKVILDLCGGSGNWSLPYRETGYDVQVIDLPTDVRLMHYPGKVHGILAAPPCTVFASSGARWARTDDDYIEALSVVDACLRLVTVCQPNWWVLENPIGKLVRWLGKPKMYFNPCDYGNPYTKKTALWGEFNTNLKKTPVDPTGVNPIHWASPGQKRAALRALTPLGFSRAFFEANP